MKKTNKYWWILLNYFFQSKKPMKSRNKWKMSSLLRKYKIVGKRGRIVTATDNSIKSSIFTSHRHGTKVLMDSGFTWKTHTPMTSLMKDNSRKNQAFTKNWSNMHFTRSIAARRPQADCIIYRGTWEWYSWSDQRSEYQTPQPTFRPQSTA